jgi:hypothetical protein
MTLPVSGAISFNAINVELGVAGTTTANINQASYRTLAGVASGQISLSNFYGKSNRVSISTTLAGGATGSLNVTTIGGYVAGKSDITVTVNGIYYGSGATPGLTLTGGTSGDTLTLVNNSYIVGSQASNAAVNVAGSAGGPALSLGYPTAITNNGYIGGGGGNGGSRSTIGGQGAGGNSTSGVGGNGTTSNASSYSPWISCGGGGGWGGAGGGAYSASSNNTGSPSVAAGGGRGANGADGSGTSSKVLSYSGGAAGKAINLNGYSVTSWGSPGQVRVYGGIS